VTEGECRDRERNFQPSKGHVRINTQPMVRAGKTQPYVVVPFFFNVIDRKQIEEGSVNARHTCVQSLMKDDGGGFLPNLDSHETAPLSLQLGDFLKRVSQAQAIQIPNISPIWAVWECSEHIAQRV
jgi:hypothetical protein